jgi:ubiquinone biosynthesis protein UbiJ
VASLEQALNRYLALDPEGACRLEALSGKVILIEIAGFGTRLYLIPGPRRIQLYADYDAEADCTLRGTPIALARMGMVQHKERELFSREVEIEGDAELAQAFGELIAELDVDWEEQLARIIGDAAAHRVGSGLRAAGRWGRRSADTLAKDLKEYLEEEARLIPSGYELRELLDAVDKLRDDVERMDARVDRLKRRAGETGGKQ